MKSKVLLFVSLIGAAVVGGILFAGLGIWFPQHRLIADVPFYRCQGQAQCDLSTKLWETKQEGRQDMIDALRDCKHLYVQREEEPLQHFMATEFPEYSCVIFRRSPQRGPLNLSSTSKNVTYIGGTFNGD